MKATVDWFRDDRGFGFASSHDGKRIFIHYTQIVGSGFKSLDSGDEVELDLYETPGGYEGKVVKKL
jgi:CspA family cold shock protein